MKYICCLCFFFIGFAANAQNADSLTIINTPWQTDTVSTDVVWKHYHFNNQNLFGSNQNINIIEIKKKSRHANISFAADADSLHITSFYGTQANALAAINGTFFDVKNGGSVDYIKVDGKVINNNRLSKERARHQKAAITINGKKVKVLKWNGKPDWELRLKQKYIMNSGPLLRYHNNNEPLDTADFNVRRHPRSCFVITKKSILLITVDGRLEQSAGMSLFELRSLATWLGGVDVLNLDGGGSTTLWVRGQPDNGVVNTPSDNKKFDHFGQRKVANVILVNKKP